MNRHYLDLVYMRRFTLLMSAVIAGILAWSLSQFLLREAPTFRSTVSITMQPSDEELSFNRAFMGVSQFNPPTIIAQSHVERLLSVPVKERAIALVLEAQGGVLSASEPSSFDKLKTAFWQKWNTLNYGYFTPLTPQQDLLNQMTQAIKLEIVEGSYIIQIEVSYPYPDLAAEIANAYAQAYIEVAREEFGLEAGKIRTVVDGLVENRRAELEALNQRRSDLQRELGVGDLTVQWGLLLNAQQTALEAVQTARVDLEIAQQRLAQLRTSTKSAATTELVQRLQQELTLSTIDLAGLEQRLPLLEASARSASADVSNFVVKQQRVGEIDAEIDAVSISLAELQSTRMAIDLSNEAQLSQVRVVNPAIVPLYPASPKVLINTVIAVIVGGLLALFPVIISDALGNRINTQFDFSNEVPGRLLPPAGKRLGRDAAEYSKSGRSSRRLKQFAEGLGKALGRDGAWRMGRIYVTGYSSDVDVAALTACVSAAVDLLNKSKERSVDCEVIALPEVTRIVDLSAYESGVLVVGVAPGTAAEGELAEFHPAAPHELGFASRRDAKTAATPRGISGKPYFVKWG